MDLKETIDKLREVVFVRKGTQQPCKFEEEALKDFEDQLRKEDAERAAVLKAIEDNKGEIESAEAKIHALGEKLEASVVEWRAVAFELFRAERHASKLHDEKYDLMGKAGMDKSRIRFSEKIQFGSPSNRWVDVRYDPIAEDFRRELILDNRKYYGETRGRPRKVRKPAGEGLPFIPEQAMALLGAGIELPAPMRRAYDRWVKENPNWGRAPEAR